MNDPTPRSKGTFVLPYAWDGYVAGELSFREMSLLAEIDRYTNPFGFRHPKQSEDGTPEVQQPPKFIDKSMRELCDWLNCDRTTLNEILDELVYRSAKNLRDVFIGRKIDQYTYRLITYPRPGETPKVLLPNHALAAFRSGTLSGPAVALLAKLASMRDVRAGNEYLAKEMGCNHPFLMRGNEWLRQIVPRIGKFLPSFMSENRRTET